MKTYQDYVNEGKYNEKQLAEIKLGIESQVDVTVYANPKWHWSQFRQIRLALEKKGKEDE